jgi:mRNA interferase MazF
MINFKSGDIVEVPFPFIDLPVRKRRPALVLSSEILHREQGLVILAMVTSAERSSWKSDVTLNDWREEGLKAPSVVRWKIVTLEAALILENRGALSTKDRIRVSASFRRSAASFLF